MRPPPRDVLIANRGEIALRIIRTATELGSRTVAVYAEDDADSPHVHAADEAIALRGNGVAAYLDQAAVLDGAKASGVTLVHPGYGFLSENPEFARACTSAGLVFVGPDAEVLELVGNKSSARASAVAAGVPVLAATEGPSSVEDVPENPPEAIPTSVANVLAERTPGARVALYAGRLAPNKGLDLVVDAAARAPEWLVLVAGEDRQGAYGEALRQRSAALGASNVRFLGWVPNVAMPALYDAVDLVLLPFLRPEPLSRGMVEALSRGRALVATPHGGPLDGVVDGSNGTFFQPTADGLVDALGRLATTDLAALGRKSRAIYEERFRPDRVVAAHLEAYERLLQDWGARK